MRLIRGAGSPLGSGGGENSLLEGPGPRPWPPPPTALWVGTPTPSMPFSLAVAMACCWSVSNKLKSRSPRRSCSSFSLAEPSSDITAGSEVRSASERSLAAVLSCRWVELEDNRWFVVLPEWGLLATLPARPEWAMLGFLFLISSFSRVKRRSMVARYRESFISFFLFFFSGRWRLRAVTLLRETKTWWLQCFFHSEPKQVTPTIFSQSLKIKMDPSWIYWSEGQRRSSFFFLMNHWPVSLHFPLIVYAPSAVTLCPTSLFQSHWITSTFVSKT